MDLIKEIKKLENGINKKLKDNYVLIKILGSENGNKGKIIILKNKKIDKIFEINAISCCQINIVENGKIIENGLFTDCLGKWIYNLYNPVEYLYAFYGKSLNGSVLTSQQITLIANGFTKCYSKEREKGAVVPRKELDNQPIVKGYIGPMFDKIDYGKVYLRYETQEIYDMLSD